MQSCSPVIERSRALLGTFVSIRVEGLTPATIKIIDHCFAEIGEIHRLMSFQEYGSDISRLNRQAHQGPVRVDVRTYDVLRHAAEISQRSGGVFDVTVAPQLVRAQLQQPPPFAPVPDPDATWTDVALLPDLCVRFARPLWIDVSGIAKGYAVDRVMEILSTVAVTQVCVNAGGDLGVRGPRSERVRLDVDIAHDTVIPFVELKDGSMASSGTRPSGAGSRPIVAVHIDGASRCSAPLRFVSVVASSCIVADALTKVVMALGTESRAALRHFSARALMSDGATDWREVA